jgi:hypothetical protein
MRRFLVLFSFVIPISLYSQKAQELIQKGNDAYEQNNFLLADSLYTAALEQYGSGSDPYHNRSIVRFIMGDTCNACFDWKILKDGFFDKMGKEQYNKFCLKRIDTTFYDKSFTPISDKKGCTFYEVTKYPKYDTQITGEIHKEKYSSINKEPKPSQKPDLVAAYIIKNNTKFYTQVSKSSFARDNEEALRKYDEFIQKFLLQNYNCAGIIFKVFLYIDDKGIIKDAEPMGYPYCESHSTIDSAAIVKMRSEIIKSISRIPRLVPEKLFNTNVNYIYNLVIFKSSFQLNSKNVNLNSQPH